MSVAIYLGITKGQRKGPDDEGLGAESAPDDIARFVAMMNGQ